MMGHGPHLTSKWAPQSRTFECSSRPPVKIHGWYYRMAVLQVIVNVLKTVVDLSILIRLQLGASMAISS